MDSTATSSLSVMRPAPRRLRPRPRLVPAVPRLSVVVVNYLQWQDTASLVRQLRATPALRHGAAEVVIVDNDSPWNALIPQLRQVPGVSLRRWRNNRGFARAVNEGVRLSRGDWVLLLNPDMSLEPGFLDKALARAEELARTDRAHRHHRLRPARSGRRPAALGRPLPDAGVLAGALAAAAPVAQVLFAFHGAMPVGGLGDGVLPNGTADMLGERRRTRRRFLPLLRGCRSMPARPRARLDGMARSAIVRHAPSSTARSNLAGSSAAHHPARRC